MFASAIKSRPQYAGLKPQPSAALHLIAVEGAGVASVLALLDSDRDVFADRTEVLLAATAAASAADVERLGGICHRRCQSYPTIGETLAALDGRLATATMGTRLYAAGTEGFVGQVIQTAINHGVDHRSVVTAHGGSLARRVQCVHCKGFTEDVTTSIFECPHCGSLLFVRDHYSRRLAAFQGVCVNAEDRSVRPAPEEIYL